MKTKLSNHVSSIDVYSFTRTYMKFLHLPPLPPEIFTMKTKLSNTFVPWNFFLLNYLPFL